MTATVTASVTPEDVQEGLTRFLAGTAIQFCCPIQRALQRTTDRVAVVFRFAWHLGEQDRGKDRIPATVGEPLPEEAVVYIARFDAWAKAVRLELLRNGDDDVDRAITAVKERRPAALSFTVALPTRPMKEEEAP